MNIHPMTAVVFGKYVPIGGSHLQVNDDQIERIEVAMGLDPVDEVGLEWALQARAAGMITRVVVATMGPDDAVAVGRRARAMGADDALLVSDGRLAEADVATTARVLARIVRHLQASIAVFGYESLDGSSGTVPAAVAAVLDWPLASRCHTTELHDDVPARVVAQRDTGEGRRTIHAHLPAVLSFAEGGVIPRYPKLKDVLRSRKLDIPTLSLDDLPPDPGWVAPADRATERVAGVRSLSDAAREPIVLRGTAGVDALLDLLEIEGIISA